MCRVDVFTNTFRIHISAYSVLFSDVTCAVLISMCSAAIIDSFIFVAAALTRKGSVVRTSVFDWRTFPDLRLMHG